MGQMLISVVFKVLNALASIILAPVFAVASLIIPDFSVYLSSMNLYLGYILHYFNFIIDFLLIPRAPLIAVATLGLGILTFNITMRVVGLSMAIYKWFKP